MDTHDEMETSFDTIQQVLSVIDIEVEFSLQSIVDQDTSLDIDLVALRVPGGLVGDGDSLPPVGVDFSESLADASDDSLGQHVGLQRWKNGGYQAVAHLPPAAYGGGWHRGSRSS